jgi:F-type H+-transporting ATPase subunit b
MAATNSELAYGAEAGHESAGLPQFDVSFFPSQLFWLAVFFGLLYLLLDRALLPRLSGVIAQRASKISGDIDAAAAANAEAKAALEAYDQSIAQARSDGRGFLDEARAAAAAERSARMETAEQALNERLSAAEKRLSGQRAEGLAAAEAAAGEVAEAIVGKLVSSTREAA